VPRGELLLLLALHREVEREEASVVLVVQLAKEYRTTHEHQIADQVIEFPVERELKKPYKVLGVVVGRLEVVTQHLRQDHGLHNHNSSLVPLSLTAHELGPLNHNQVLRFLAHPLRRQHQRMAVLVQHDPHFLMHSNAGRPCQPIGKDLPRSGFEDLKRTAMRSIEILFPNNSLDK
jgi:hypothetical protein